MYPSNKQQARLPTDLRLRSNPFSLRSVSEPISQIEQQRVIDNYFTIGKFTSLINHLTLS
jgi:hypothetical protein